MKRGNDKNIWLHPNSEYEMPPRSTLARLEPVGLGSPFVESLTSYYLRLAYLHRLTPLVLSRSLILPKMKGFPLTPSTFKEPHWNMAMFSGANIKAHMWAKRLEELTGMDDLQQLTFSHLRNYIPSKYFMSKEKKWCPACYEEFIDSGQIYDQLLFEVDTVSACPKHGIKLVNKCSCGHLLSPSLKVRAASLPGVCQFCGIDLSSEKNCFREKAGAHEIQRAKLVGDFIKNRNLIEKSMGINKSGFIRFVRGIIDNHCESVAELSRLLSISKSQLSEWFNCSHNPIFPKIVDIAIACNCSIANVYLGEYDVVSNISPIFIKKNEGNNTHKDKLAWKSVNEDVLEKYLKANKPLSLISVARELGVSDRFLRENFRKISTEISNNFRKRRSEVAHIAFEKRCISYKEAAEKILSCGRTPTFANVTRELNSSFSIREREVCQRICRQVIDKNSDSDLQR